MADVEIEVSDGVTVATMNRPERMNSLGGTLSKELRAAVDRASHDDDVRVLVLTGAGRAFCAGAEVTSESPERLAGGSGGTMQTRFDRMNLQAGSADFAQAFAQCDVPIIGAINGAAAGAGFGIALCCDVRIFGESGRLGSIFIHRGVASDYGAAYWLPRIVGVARAFEIFYDGRMIDSARALELGLANRVVPDDELLAEATAYAGQIAAGPPMGYTGIRRLLQDSVDSIDRAVFLDRKWATQTALLRTSDAAEGFRSFIERRDPEFTGT